MVGHLRHIDESLAKRVADTLGINELPNAPAAAPVLPMKLSPALQIIGKMKDTLAGRTVGILIADGSDGRAIKIAMNAVAEAGARVKVVATTVGVTKLADGSIVKADGQLAGTPSVLFDAVVVLLSEAGAKLLSKESAAIDFVRDAFAHLKAIGVDSDGHRLLKEAKVEDDAGIIDISDMEAFIAAAKTRQWTREALVRIPV
jgi:catalase